MEFDVIALGLNVIGMDYNVITMG